MNKTPRPRRKTSAPNWTPSGWPRAEYRLPSAAELERLSREGPIDADQADPVDAEPTNGQLEQLELDLSGEHAGGTK